MLDIRKRPVTLILLLLAVLAIGWRFYEISGETGRKPGPPTVKTTTITTKQWVDQLESVGTARADEYVALTARITDKVKEIRMQEGELVTQGQAIMLLDGAETDAQLREAEATFADAQREYNRVKDLSTTAIPKAQKDQRLARFLEAKARLAAASARLKDYAIIAPFDGVLGLRNVSPGSLVQPGDVVTTIAKVDKIKVDATLPEAALSKIELGMSIKATTPARPGKEFIGTLVSLDNQVDAATRAFTYRAEIDNADRLLMPGMLLSVTLQSTPRQAVVVPESAIMPLGVDKFVFRYNPKDSTVSRIKVTIGNRRPGEVEIIEGLAEGDSIVTTGVLRLKDGEKVTLANAAAKPKED